jgi:lysophospholipase L1-like esterase
VQILNSEGKIIREMLNTESLSRVTDWQPFNEVGKFYWRVCVVDKNKNQLSDWSEKKLILVSAPVTFAALGDSITHGGANFIPAGQISCQWESFCNQQIKNIGRSGDTTAMMIERFERDVLPFQPKILLIMGGVNDIREGATAEEVIKNYEILRDKCTENNIIPVFCTITPMNEEIMTKRGIYFVKRTWMFERRKINDWILKNGGAYVASLENHAGELRSGFTPDGLHPDMRGKMMIGKSIEKFLSEKYPDFH